MSSRDHHREYRRERTYPWIAVCVGVAALAYAVKDGVFWAPFQWGPFLLALVLVGGATAWAIWGVRILLDRRPRIITDRKGITVPLHPGGPLVLRWVQISSLVCDVRMGEVNAVLRVVAEEDGEPFEHTIRIGGLDASPQAIYDHVLTCHTELGPKPGGAPVPAREAPRRTPDTATARASDTESRSPGEQTFLPRGRFPFDLRIVGGVLTVLGLVGVIAGYAAGGNAGEIHGVGPTLVTIVSLCGLLFGFVTLVINLKQYGTGPLPPQGWPRLMVSAESITLAENPDDELCVPWNRVRNVVRLKQEDSSGKATVQGVTVYYLTSKGTSKQFTIGLAGWEDPQGVLGALLHRGDRAGVVEAEEVDRRIPS
jgi:hypothetical protein